MEIISPEDQNLHDIGIVASLSMHLHVALHVLAMLKV